eukprot:IDg13330t1
MPATGLPAHSVVPPIPKGVARYKLRPLDELRSTTLPNCSEHPTTRIHYTTLTYAWTLERCCSEESRSYIL